MDKLKLDLSDFGMRASSGLHTVLSDIDRAKSGANYQGVIYHRGLKDLLDSQNPLQKIVENFRESLISSQSNRVEELLRLSRLSLRDFAADYAARFEEREKQLWKDKFGCIPGFVGKRNLDIVPEISQPPTIPERESETVQLIRADDYAAMRKALARLNGKKSAQSETVR